MPVELTIPKPHISVETPQSITWNIFGKLSMGICHIEDKFKGNAHDILYQFEIY